MAVSDLPFNIVKDKINYIELEEHFFLDYKTIALVFGFSKADKFFKDIKENKGIFVYDLNRFLKENRHVPDPQKDCPFIGFSSIQYNNDVVLEKMLRKVSLSIILKYPPNIIHNLLKDCPYYMFGDSTMRWYRRVEVHYHIYRASIYNKNLPEDIKTLKAVEAISQKVTKESMQILPQGK